MSTATVIAEIELRHPELVLAPTIESVPDVTAELEYQTIVAPDEYYLFFHVYGGDLPGFERAIRTDPTVSAPTVVIDGGDFRVYRMRLTSAERLVLPQAAELGMRVLHARSGAGGWIARLEVPDLEALWEFREYCTARDVSFRVRRLYRSGEAGRGEAYGLTPLQRETLLAAYENGYFNDPRDVSMVELAEQLGVSPSAVSGRLRRAVRSLVEATLVR